MAGRMRAVLFAAWLGATVAGIGAGLANYLAWRVATPLPTAAQAVEVVHAGVPGAAIVSVGWHDDVHDISLIAHPGPGQLPGEQEVNLVGTAASRAAFDAARQRLAGSGWRTVPGAGYPRGGAFFLAVRGDLVTEWEFAPAGTYDEPSGDTVRISLWRYTPSVVEALTLLGWLVGAALGGWLVRVVRRRADPRVTVAAWVAMAVFAVSTVVAAGLTVEGLLHRPVRDGSPQAVWEAYVPFLLPFGFQLG